MSEPAGLQAYRLAYQISPIFLTGGIAQQFGGIMPIIAITESANFGTGLLGGLTAGTSLGSLAAAANLASVAAGLATGSLTLNDFFANFVQMPGAARLVSFRYGEYPYASQQIAANAAIQQPLRFSLMMHCPVKSDGGYATKLATLFALQQAINQHINQGGTFTVLTPGCIYTSCLLNDITDASGRDSHQANNAYVWDFYQPLVTLDSAAAAQNGLMSKLTAGLPIGGLPAQSGLGVATSPSLSSAGINLGAGSPFPTGSASPLAAGGAGGS